jgi:hypothetical protein
MSRFLALLRFEAAFYLGRLSTWVYFSCLAGVAFLMMLVFGGAFPDAQAGIEGTDGNVMVNSPHVLLILISLFAAFGTLVTAALAGNAGYRDFAETMHPLVFSTPVTKMQYFASRYVGTVLINMIVLGGIGIGLWLGSIWPWVDGTRFGPTVPSAFLTPYLIIVLPNVLFTSAIFLSLAMLTRKRMPHYIGGTVLLLGYLLSRTLLRDLELKWIVGLIDPFGMGAVRLATEYWTTIERNSQLLGLSGWILWNRLLWTAIALAIAGLAAWRFKFSYAASEGGRRRQGKIAIPGEAAAPAALPQAVPAAHRTFGGAAVRAQYAALTGRAFREVVASPFFIAILIAGVLFLLLQATKMESAFGTNTWPMAWKVIEVLGGTFTLFVMILVTLYAGELAWRERDLKLSQVIDATPTPSWIGFMARLSALVGMVVFLLVAVFVAGILTQAFMGFYRFEPGLYLEKIFGMQLVDYVLLCILALTVHTVVNHKYTGHFILIMVYLILDLAPLLGLEHSMWRYDSDLGQTYSDMNRHGWYLGPWLWLKLYWSGAAILMAVLSNLVWPRGVDTEFGNRVQSARMNLKGAALTVGILGVVLSLGAGGFVFYNTNVMNTYRSSTDREKLQARYEKDYKKYEGLPQPRITSVSIEADIYPESGNFDARGTFTMVNRSGEAIAEIHVLLDSAAEVRRLEFDRPSELTLEDKPLGYRIFRLATPLDPDGVAALTFDLGYPRHGFSHTIQNRVVENGSFVDSSILPGLGYHPAGELELDRVRKKHGLAPKERMRDLDDPEGRRDNYISQDADWVDFEAVVSTSADQVALAPGYLQKEWEKGDRRYFHYAMDAPILNFFSFLSARYEVLSDSWNDVAIEVYYHPGHEFNIEKMVSSVKKSLDYFSREFSPYQHRQVRIVEFPRYASFAQSFPNTIPYSESIGFIARVGEDDLDYPFFVTAHEVAHQWWAHQVIGADLQGSTALSETLAEYSALMVMEHEYGKDKMRRFLEYEQDQYLWGRSMERKKELPLLRVEDQPYIHYRKGAVIMYALADAIGEEAVNRALSRLLDTWAFTGPPYPTSRDLLAELRAETPEALRPWLSDLFEHITIYENRAMEARSREGEDGRYVVTLTFESRKLHAGEQGEEIEVPLDDPMDIGVFDSEGEALYLEKHLIDGSIREITVTVEGVPARAGIDPYHKLIDRHPDDNEVDVEPAAQ